MSIFIVILVALLGVVIGAAFSALAAKSKSAALIAQNSTLEREASELRGELQTLTTEHRGMLGKSAALEATLASERQSAGDKLRLLDEASEEMRTHFRALAASALESNNASFLDLARATLERYQSEARGELEKREKAVETLVKPISESLRQVDEQVRQLEASRAQAYGALSSQVASLLETQRALQTETGNLVKALREPQARGRWGELQLRRVIEIAGMLEYCDFDEQLTVTNEDRRIRPDVIVRLPGDKQVVVDSKAPLVAYLAALEAQDEATRSARLADHARQIRTHIDNLGSKNYWAQFKASPEFVVLFLPGEVFFRAAMDVDLDLIDYAIERKVILASPTTLIALLKAVAYGWNQKNLAENARRISEAGKQLYERVCVMTRNFEDIGTKLDAALTSYNKTVGSMQRSVFPAGRRLAELDRSLASEDLQDVQPIEKNARQLDAPDWRDDDAETGLLFPGDKAEGAKA